MSIHNSVDSANLPDRLTSRTAVVVTTDILNSLKLAKDMQSTEHFALFLDAYYTLCSQHIRENGGDIVKYIGDSCLAIFDEDQAVTAVQSLQSIRSAFPEFCDLHGVARTDLSCSVHIGDVIYGTFGPEGQRDILGRAVNNLFQLRGRGIVISEQVYRKLPSADRGPWRKSGGQVIYELN